MVCHGELARLRPPAERLTEFYLFLSIGGVLGGAFNALLVPSVFSRHMAEIPLALVALCLLRPVTMAERSARSRMGHRSSARAARLGSAESVTPSQMGAVYRR